MASELQRRVDAKICLSLTYALNDKEEVGVEDKITFSYEYESAACSNKQVIIVLRVSAYREEEK